MYHLTLNIFFPVPLLKVETCGFLFWEGFQPNIPLAYQNSSILLICMGMRYVYNFNFCSVVYSKTFTSDLKRNFAYAHITNYWGLLYPSSFSEIRKGDLQRTWNGLMPFVPVWKGLKCLNFCLFFFNLRNLKSDLSWVWWRISGRSQVFVWALKLIEGMCINF